ncbi:SusC/RagA family TonB-linked outer membrane protein [Labilibaculum sp. K2S]|uniref:SusC/RagA family TonB-linked outer membrane protein n=1 Tax=Labilibaculum sp. K2S TaxID=3056386 RepID=UPI0025A3C5AE|nr:SusC/RagA family TonB-linked outer membrane protein [Labilibaculum sp. K2S]MDM8158443.1 SusC/RagA family TonB-linked outer membrane protein [Labilibaculum sp. K2S]
MKKLVLYKVFPLGEELRKLIRIMKITGFLILIASLQISASVYSQQTTFTVEFKDASIYDMMQEVKNSSEFDFLYSDDEIEGVKINNAEFYGSRVEEILNECLKGTKITYKIEDKVILLMPAPPKPNLEESVQEKEVHGTVTDENGIPLPGVSVVIKGTTIGAATDIDGNYTISFDNENAVLVYSFVGMLPQELVYNGQALLNITLQADSEQMDEVVVTGYQTISKERSTGSFSKVTGKSLETRRLNSLADVLEGQIAGYSDGIIRGVSTMNAMASPLYVIDGFPVENTSIDNYGNVTENTPELNMEDIESITILKDAAAASIYGARAANGVVVIVTKKAQKGKVQIDFSSTVTWKPYDYYTGNLTNSADVIELEKEWAASNPELNNGLARAQAEADNRRNNYKWPSAGVDVLLDMYSGAISESDANAKLSELASRGFQYYDDVAKYAKRDLFYQQYNLSIGKATELNNFKFSVTYKKNKEEDIYSKSNQIGMNIMNSLQLTSWLKADLGVYINYKNATEQTYDLLSPYSAGFTGSPYDRLVDDNGTTVSVASQVRKTVRDNVSNYGLYSLDLTPLDELNRKLGKTKEFSNRTYAKLNVKITPWLNYDAMFQYEYGVNRYQRLNELDSYSTRTTINKFASNSNGSAVYNLPKGDIYYDRNHFSNSYNFRQQLNLNKTFQEKHQITWILGSETRHSKLEYSDQTRYGYDSDMLTSQYLNQPLLTGGFSGLMNSWAYLGANDLASQRELVNRFVSFYSNAAYSYNNKYTLSGSIRWDRSNLWGTNSKYQNKPLWSVGANWNVNKEDFFDLDWVNMLKLRTSYGIGGNIAKDAAPYLTASYYTSSLVGGVYGNISSPPNPDLRWEKTTTINAGADFSLFNNRLSGSVDVYKKKSVDLLANQQGTPTEGFGYNTLAFNNGSMENKGVELAVQADLVHGKNFTWNAGFLLGYNKNKVTKINVEAPFYVLQFDYPQEFPRVNNAFNGIYSYKWAGLNDQGEPQIYDVDGNKTSTDYTNMDNIHFSGTTVPKYSGSIMNRFSYKNFDLSVLLLYAGGHKVRNTNIPKINMADPYGSAMISVTNKDIRNRWKQAGDENKTDVPRLLFYGNSPDYNYYRESVYNYSDIHVLDASYVKINNISLAYHLPSEWCSKLKLGSARVQFNVENLKTFAFEKKAEYMLGAKERPTFVGGVYLSF